MSFLRHPHLSGDTLVLVAEDDLWTAPVAGGRAHRLTRVAQVVRGREPSVLVSWLLDRSNRQDLWMKIF
ncbi:hypothetical protein [Pseudonocardia sp. ICBG601]|uniref:hypothetical protein n=1 Tax=Pseudonocardia sp. ICBG601 TaxID=2846759 RepID=UPI001CF6DC33|nr:hypothetical protein [Pseudonocardia sp. ICBG601]